MFTFKDLTNQKFGRLTAAWPAGQNQSGHIMWLCFCECSKFKVVSSGSLTSGHTKSCGCLNREVASQRALKHGHARIGNKTPEYRAYQNAKNRCANPEDTRYADYGGRGVEFKFASFEEFFAEVGPKPSPELMIDRINNDGPYAPGNIRWVSPKESIHNRRPSRPSRPRTDRMFGLGRRAHRRWAA